MKRRQWAPEIRLVQHSREVPRWGGQGSVGVRKAAEPRVCMRGLPLSHSPFAVTKYLMPCNLNERFIFGSWLQYVQSIARWLHGRNSMEKGPGQRAAAYMLEARRQRETGGAGVKISPSRAHSQ